VVAARSDVTLAPLAPAVSTLIRLVVTDAEGVQAAADVWLAAAVCICCVNAGVDVMIILILRFVSVV
jgi:hypothetical protein